MKQYNTREFEQLLVKNGYEKTRADGKHIIYEKGDDSIAVPKHSKINYMICKRLIKEHGLRTVE